MKNWYKSRTIFFGIAILLISAYAIHQNHSAEMYGIFIAGIGVIYCRATAKELIK
jgi:hypothetical protein